MYGRRLDPMSETKSKMQQYAAGLKAGVPVILGFVPVGIAYAIMAQQAGFSVFETIFMSAAVFAGASQMMAVGMYVQGAGAVAMILATFILLWSVFPHCGQCQMCFPCSFVMISISPSYPQT